MGNEDGSPVDGHAVGFLKEVGEDGAARLEPPAQRFLEGAEVDRLSVKLSPRDHATPVVGRS